ncbi:hypothetical protein F5Y17DRAFT_471181 [Xylariaceae sp. FL0594]|nr:hypothetical protein F5Y17DRAFT_471181 [Xylariaceae sp. FL0594]
MPPRYDSVLQTTELLENILEQLDIRTLLTSAQRVSRRWQGVIKQSPRLQEALFFRPAPTPPPATPDSSDASPSVNITVNPLLAEVFPLCFPNEEVEEEGADAQEQCRLREQKQRAKTLWKSSFDSSPLARDERLRKAWMYPDASWRRMLVRQPPVVELGVWEHWHAMGGDSHKFSVEEFPEGLRMDHLYDEATQKILGAEFGFRMFWGNPHVRPQSRDWRGGRSLRPEQRQRLDDFCDKMELIMHLTSTMSCCPRGRNEEMLEFQQRFTHPRFVHAERIRRDLETGGERQLLQPIAKKSMYLPAL